MFLRRNSKIFKEYFSNSYMKKRGANKNIREKLLASFSVGVGFWLINISHVSSLIYGYITAMISGLAFIFLFFFSIRAIRQKEKILGWTYFLMEIVMILSWIILFITGLIEGLMQA